jgi:transcriptional regulator with XRE-family HTH domain
MTNLQRIRKEKGLTQKQLAEKSGVNLKMIQKYETGERDINHAQALTVYQLACALKAGEYELLEVTDESRQKIIYLQIFNSTEV